MYYFELRNRENEFVACATIECDYDESINEAFNNEITEYDWAEDQTKENALEILKSVLILLADNPDLNIGLVYEFDNIEDSFTKDLVSKNAFTGEINSKNGIISFIKQYANFTKNEAEECCIKACEDILPQY